MKNPPTAILLPLLVLGSASLNAGAGVTPAPPVTPAVKTTPRFILDLSTQFEFADPSTAGPSGDVIHSRVAVPLFIPLSDNWRLIGVVRGGYSDYETAPFDTNGVQIWNAGGLLTLDGQFNETWSGTFGVLGGASWEEGASFSDSLNGGGLAMAGYRFSPTLKIGLGGLYLTRQNENPLIVPAIGLDWEVTPQFDVKLYGLDLRAEYELNKVWSVFLRGEFDPFGAILKSRPDSEADSFVDQGFRAAGGLTWTPCPSFALTLEGGVAFHEYTLRNDREEILAKDRVDPAPFLGVSARLSF